MSWFTPTEKLIDDYDTSTNPVTQSILNGIITERLKECADYRDFPQQPKDYEENE